MAVGKGADVDLSGLVLAQDAGTAACGLFNAAYFAHYWSRQNGQRARRLAAVAMALVSVAAVVEAAWSEALFWSERGGLVLASASPGAWALARLPLFAATAVVAVIVVRRMRWAR